MKTNTSKKIIAYIKEKKQATAKELTDYLEISPRAVFKQLKKLITEDRLIKHGKPPMVYYSLSVQSLPKTETDLPAKISNYINSRYLLITPEGQIREGLNGFSYWCQKQNLPLKKTAQEYLKTGNKYDLFKKNGYISGLEKFKSSFNQVFLDEIYYLDFYSIERFGKTKLGNLLLYAKQSQNKKLIKSVGALTKEKIYSLVKKKKIGAIGFIPPTVKREIQFLKELEKEYSFNLPKVKILKASADIAVPQKTLSKLNDRIANAAKSIFVPDQPAQKNILLIDDAVGSGATFNETAKKIRRRGLAKGKIIGLALTGSFKGFDIISEV